MEYQFGDLVEHIANKLGEGWTAYADLATAQQTRVGSVINSGYNQFLRPPILPGERKHHEWGFLRPIHTLTAWASTESTLDGAPTSDDGGTTSIVTVDDAMFYDNMTDSAESLTIGDNTYPIASVTSTTVCVVTGDAQAETDETECSVTADGDYRLPADYGAIAGPLTFAVSSGYSPIKIVSETAIRRVRRHNSGTGTPVMAGIRALAIDQTALQEFDLLLYPIPNTAYELTYRYHVRLSEIDDTNCRLPGAADHSEIILQACLAAAEQRMFDQRGDEYANFLQMLPAAISFDRMAHSAEHFGTPGDAAHYGILHATDEFVTVGGTLR